MAWPSPSFSATPPLSSGPMSGRVRATTPASIMAVSSSPWRDRFRARIRRRQGPRPSGLSLAFSARIFFGRRETSSSTASPSSVLSISAIVSPVFYRRGIRRRSSSRSRSPSSILSIATAFSFRTLHYFGGGVHGCLLWPHSAATEQTNTLQKLSCFFSANWIYSLIVWLVVVGRAMARGAQICLECRFGLAAVLRNGVVVRGPQGEICP